VDFQWISIFEWVLGQEAKRSLSLSHLLHGRIGSHKLDGGQLNGDMCIKVRLKCFPCERVVAPTIGYIYL